MVANVPRSRLVRSAAVLLLSLACFTWANEQRTFGRYDSQDSRGPPPPPSSNQFKSVHLSHSGIYLSSPIAVGAPRFLTLFAQSPLYNVESVKIAVGPKKQRNWEQVNLDCGPLGGGGIEWCEQDDLRELNTTTLPAAEPCEPYKIIPSQSKVLIDTASCPSLTSLLSASTRTTTAESYMDSITLSFEIQRAFPSRIEKHLFWIGKLVRAADKEGGDGGALWPYAAQDSKKGSKPAKWDGRVPNRISEQMQDPYFPKAYKTDSSDVMNGVDLIESTWSLGISIRAPTNSNHSKPSDREFESVHAPVSGQIVWLGDYIIPRAPANGRNDEKAFAVMIRDEWGFVYQLLGLNSTAISVDLGEIVTAGHVIGATSRTPLSWEPPCRHKPSDPPKMYDNSRRYPYRNRVLRVLVARPDPEWKEWKRPLESGWQYFNPLDAFTTEQFRSIIPPDPNPKQLYFARPSEDGGLTPPSIFATTKDLFQPATLSGNVEIIVGFDSFIATPDNIGDSLDPTALHALEWAVWPKADVGDVDRGLYACSKPKDVEWRLAFEHAKLPNNWSVSLLKNALLAHYVPAFVVGTVPFFKTKYASSFDEKSRKLYYAPTRTVVGLPDGRGYWDTTKEPDGDGIYEVWVHGRDWFGNEGCFGANVRIKNS